MPKTEQGINYKALEDALLKRTYKLSEVKDRIEKVAFDIVRFKDEDKGAELWQVMSAEDGDYIVALYDDEEPTKTASVWQVQKNANALQFSYKGAPIVKIAANKLGIPENEISLATRYLPEKLARNKVLVNALLSELTEPAKKMVYSKYPELAEKGIL